MVSRHTVVVILILMLVVKVRPQSCSLPSPGSNQELQLVLQHHILHKVYPRCQSVDFSRQQLVCEIWDKTDEDTFICMGRLNCPDGYNHLILASSCADGSFKKTCGSSDLGTFHCVCHSLKKESSCATLYVWDSEWRDIEGKEQGLYRKLCNPETLSCPITEYRFGVAHLVIKVH